MSGVAVMIAKRENKRRVRKLHSKVIREARSEKGWVKVKREEYEGLKETIDLLSRPANARRLRSALAQAKAGKLKEREL